MTDSLEIHVLGGDIGESIVVGLPENRWGVVDIYTPNLKDKESSATYRFLRGKDIHELDFFCLTHPHQDHIRGASYILEDFNVKEFWTFTNTPNQLFGKIATLLKIKENLSHVESVELKDSSEDLIKTFDVLDDLLEKQRPITLRVMGLGLSLVNKSTSSGTKLSIHALGPCGHSVHEYAKTLDKCFDKTNSDRIFANKLPSIPHNMISSGLLIELGSTRVVLGGDIEQEGWNHVVRYNSPEFVLKSSLVKASHHGSTNGYSENLWKDKFSPNKCSIAAITLFTQQGLPSSEGLAHIVKNASDVYTTASLSKPAKTTLDIPESAPLPAIIAVKACFSNIRHRSSKREGICSFYFDSNGSITDVKLIGDATKVELSDGDEARAP